MIFLKWHKAILNSVSVLAAWKYFQTKIIYSALKIGDIKRALLTVFVVQRTIAALSVFQQ